MTDLQTQAVVLIQDAINKAAREYNVEIPMPIVKFDLKGKTAGTANSTKNVIRLNHILLEENGQAFLDDTPVHEAAHIIVSAVYETTRHNFDGRRFSRIVKPHGYEWKSVMRKLGQNSSRTHTFDTSNAKVRQTQKFQYVCKNCQAEIPMGLCRHKKVWRGTANYLCAKCRGQLEYLHPIV